MPPNAAAHAGMVFMFAIGGHDMIVITTTIMIMMLIVLMTNFDDQDHDNADADFEYYRHYHNVHPFDHDRYCADGYHHKRL